MFRSDKIAKCSLSAPWSNGKMVAICQAGSSEEFVPNTLVIGKQLSESYVDYHDNRNARVFRRWFTSMLISNLTKDRKVVIVMDNAKYHSRLVAKSPKINMTLPLPVKPVLLQKICEANIPKKYVVDEMFLNAEYSVLRLPPYHFVFNSIEMVWSQLKYHAWH